MDDHHVPNRALNDLCDAFVLLETRKEAFYFLKDLCTPQELETLAERWKVCGMLQDETLSQRTIHGITGASLTTIGRVARFLKNEPYGGYRQMLKKINDKKDIP